ncbi:hypothetical protein AX27061_3903 [Achromobacter xylosoxidans NBRC 15126 = ATCC 27061]|nr:hypothetical protein AX27061_3903 [Achromobacter xylosoxidans NBRC 15126 = ATCC 27061]CCH09587.1 hypothetical protein NH44784_056451 [Achromobacter xylosoxidans NH44784-1996]
MVQLGNCQDIPREYVVCDCKFNCHKAFRCVPVHRAYVAGRNDTASGHFCRGWPESQQIRPKDMIFMEFLPNTGCSK